MSAPHTNGHSASDPLNGTSAPSEGLGTLDVITEAEALRTVLHEAASRVSRLLAALKLQRKQQRTLRVAMESLRQLKHFAP